MTAVVRLRGVGKSFLGVPVLRDIDLDIAPGEVHALVGENGAGKSTVMKILAGVHTPDTGTVELTGSPVHFGHPLDAQRAGIATVFQEFNLLPDRTVADNVHLGREPRSLGLVNRRRMAADTAELLESLGVDGIAPDDRVGSLSVAQQQIVEIVKALTHDTKLISMDEPSAALADREVELLYTLVRRLRDRGIAVLYVSHRMAEIFALCDTVTVLKDGRLVHTGPIADTTADELVRTMVGRAVSTVFPPPEPGTEPGPVRLRVTAGGNTQLDGIDLTVRAGEILGLAGLQGSGRTELAHALFGIAPFTRGEIAVDDTPTRIRSPRTAVRRGIALVSEDRKTEGLVLNQSIIANARLVLDALRGGRSGVQHVTGLLSSLELVARDTSDEVRFLSGGNQQKVVLAKWLAADPTVMILDEPTRGIDVGAKQAVYRLIRELAARGVAVVLISSELPEVIGLSDRILVMRDGRIGGELEAGQFAAGPTGGTDTAERAVMALATGHTWTEAPA